MAANDRDRERNRRAADGPADPRAGAPRVQNPPPGPVVAGRRPIVPQGRRSPVTWLLPLLLLLALIPLFRRDRGTGDDQRATGDTVSALSAMSAGDVANAGAVARFASWANQSSGATPTESQVSHPYVAEGIRYLADALQEVATGESGSNAAGGGGTAAAGATGGTAGAGGARSAGSAGAAGGRYTERIQRIRDRASQLEQASPNGNSAEHASTAFTEAAQLITELQGGQSTGTRNTRELTSAARAVSGRQTLGDQGPQVRTFFQRAANVLQDLSGGTVAGTSGQGAAGAAGGTGTGSPARRP